MSPNTIMPANNKALSPVRQFLVDHPEVQTFEVVITDLNGILRGKWLPRSAIDKVLDGKLKMSLTSLSADVWGRDVPILCRQTGDGDGICVAVEQSIRLLPWLERPTAQLMLQLNTEAGVPWGYDSRVILKRVVDRFKKLGLTPVCAPELEFYLLPEERQADGTPRIPSTRANGTLNLGGQLLSTEVMQEQAVLLHEMRAACELMKLPLEGLVKELAPSQYELNIEYVDDPMLAADHAQMLKQTVKSVAQKSPPHCQLHGQTVRRPGREWIPHARECAGCQGQKYLRRRHGARQRYDAPCHRRLVANHGRLHADFCAAQ